MFLPIRAKVMFGSAVIKTSIVLTILAGTPRGYCQFSLPNSAPAKVMSAFLSAFNSGDRPQLEEYVRRYDDTATVDELLAFRGSTGGFSLQSIESSTPEDLKVILKGRVDGISSFADLRLSSVNPAKVTYLIVRSLPSGAAIKDDPLTSGVRHQTLQLLENELSKEYIDVPVAKKMVDELRAHETSGAYDRFSDGNEFAETLTKELREVSHDGHIFVAYSPAVSPEGNVAAVPGPAETARYRGIQKRENCSFSDARILSGNVGYLKFNEFPDAGECGSTVTAAMGFIAHSDAVIVDLRDNHGGQPAMVQLILSYFFDEPTHLNDVYMRPFDSTRQYWTLPYVPGLKLANAPLYVLTSARTFSAAEEFVNDLKAQKRAVIVGETTRGGAHPMYSSALGDHFIVGTPVARPINPVTPGDWEGKGVAPDVEASSAEALTVAQKLANAKILISATTH